MTILGLYDRITDQIVARIRDSGESLYLVCVHGEPLSGKVTVSKKSLERLDIPFGTMSLTEISNDGTMDFVKKLSTIGNSVLTELDFIHKNCADALLDTVLSIKLKAESRRRIWIVVSSKPLNYADYNINLPDLSSDPETHLDICRAMLDGFPVDPECPLETLVVQSTKQLAIGELGALMNMAKALALGRSERLSCIHLSKAFHSLCYPASEVEQNSSRSANHVCEFSESLSRNERLESFIGMTAEMRDIISEYQESSRSKLLLISGPVGCGKSYLAQAVAWNSTQAAVRVTSADVLRSKIGETEKTLWKILSDNKRVIIEDIDKLVPEDSSDATGSIQRCCSVIAAFLDKVRFERMDDRMVIGTTRESVAQTLSTKITEIRLTNRLTYEDKIALIQSEFAAYETESLTPFDLVNLNNRSKCIEFGNQFKLKILRNALAN